MRVTACLSGLAMSQWYHYVTSSSDARPASEYWPHCLDTTAPDAYHPVMQVDRGVAVARDEPEQVSHLVKHTHTHTHTHTGILTIRGYTMTSDSNEISLRVYTQSMQVGAYFRAYSGITCAQRSGECYRLHYREYPTLYYSWFQRQLPRETGPASS